MKLGGLLLWCVILAGCSRTQSEKQYANSWGRITKDFAAYMSDLDANPFQPSMGMTRAQNRTALVAYIRATGDRVRRFENEELALKPPPKFDGLHRQTVHFYYVQADLWCQWADAASTHDRSLQIAVGTAMDKRIVEEHAMLRNELRKVAATEPDLQPYVRLMDRIQPVPGEPSRDVATKSGYLFAWRLLLFQSIDLSREIELGPPKRPPGMSDKAYGRMKSAAMVGFGRRFATFATKEAYLRPPPEMQSMHQEMLKYYRDRANDWLAMGRAAESDDDKLADKIAASDNASGDVLKIVGEAKASGIRNPDDWLAINELAKRNGLVRKPNPGKATSR